MREFVHPLKANWIYKICHMQGNPSERYSVILKTVISIFKVVYLKYMQMPIDTLLCDDDDDDDDNDDDDDDEVNDDDDDDN